MTEPAAIKESKWSPRLINAETHCDLGIGTSDTKRQKTVGRGKENKDPNEGQEQGIIGVSNQIVIATD